MLDYEKQRQLVIVFILAAILVVIGSIIALVFIWAPEKEEEKIFEVGVVDSVGYTEEDIVETYYRELAQLFMDEDLDKIYSLIGQDYLEYMELNRADIDKYLEEKGILGRQLELVTSAAYLVPGYSNIYYLDIKAVNEIYSIGVVVREISPNNYTITFDKFIDCSEDVYKATVNSVSMDIYKRVRYTNSVEYRFTLTNTYNKSIVINNNSLSNAMLLVSPESTAKQPLMNTLSTVQVKLEPEDFRGFVAVYNINDSYDYIMYNTLVLKDVAFDGIQGVTDIEFSLSK